MGRNGQKKRGGNELWERDGLRGGERREGNAATAAPLSHSAGVVGRSGDIPPESEELNLSWVSYRRNTKGFLLLLLGDPCTFRVAAGGEEEAVGGSVGPRSLFIIRSAKKKNIREKEVLLPLSSFPPCMAVGKATF